MNNIKMQAQKGEKRGSLVLCYKRKTKINGLYTETPEKIGENLYKSRTLLPDDKILDALGITTNFDFSSERC